MSSKRKNRNQKEKQIKKEERLKFANKLYQECIFGGYLENIKIIISENNFTISELEKAIEILSNSTTSAFENITASENIKFIERIIAGMKMIKK